MVIIREIVIFVYISIRTNTTIKYCNLQGV